jgi:hypothetical protein
MKKYDNLLSRRLVPKLTLLRGREAFEELQENEDIRYLLGSMEPLDADSTRITREEAKRVYSYFEGFATIRLQGSVQTNTHIKFYSDIDILTITPRFESWESGRPSYVSAYTADPIETLKDLRRTTRHTVGINFPAVRIEDKDRALRLTGGSLQRQMDIVTANWYNTATCMQSSLERDRGVEVLDVGRNMRILNKPFLHEFQINNKIAATGDGAGRAIRLLKTLKADATHSPRISSYDIAALVWNMQNYQLPGSIGSSFQLANNCANFLLNQVSNDGALLKTLWVPNGTRRIVDSEGTTMEAVRALWYELYQLLEAVKKAGRAIDKAYRIENRVLRPVA